MNYQIDRIVVEPERADLGDVLISIDGR